jgi:hypothetical protein
MTDISLPSQAQIDAVLSPDGIPVEAPPDLSVELPGGYIDGTGRLLKKAEVRELNGEDEEALARGGNSSSFIRYFNTILSRAVVGIEDIEPDHAVLQGLLMGDRMMLLLAIRRVTYGDDVEMSLTCPKCNAEFDVAIELDKDVEIREMEDPMKRTHEVPLRKEHVATVRFINGADQEAALGDGKRTVAEQNTILLSRCITHLDGKPVIGDDLILRMGLQDRKTVLQFLTDSQPGPLLEEVSVPCSVCGEVSPLPLSIEDLFRY